MRDRKFQWGLFAVVFLLLLSGPLALTSGFWIPIDLVGWPGQSDVLLYCNLLLLFLLIVIETANMTLVGTSPRSSDKGYVSALLTITAVVYGPVVDRYFLGYLVIFDVQWWFYVLGVTLFLSGAVVRWLSARELGDYFSHEIRVTDGQDVVDTGIYRFVRHPAYLGTLLIIVGCSWMFLTHFGLLLLTPAIYYTLLRIRSEERLLHDALGKAYQDYSGRTKELIPFVF